MSAATIRSLQSARFLNLQEDQDAAREDKQDALTNQKEQIEETFDHRMDVVEQMRDARQKSGLGTLIGTICCPLVGTLIGKGIGTLAGSGDRKDMNEANMHAGMSEVQRAEAQDDFAKAAEAYEAVDSQTSQLEKFSKELRRAERSILQQTY